LNSPFDQSLRDREAKIEAILDKLEKGILEEPIIIHVADDEDNIEIVIG